MKRSLVFLLAIASMSLSANAQEATRSQDVQNRKVVITDKNEVNAADRAAVAKGMKEVGRGMQGFFQALNSAVAKAHADRALANKGKTAKQSGVDTEDKPSSPR